MRWPSGPPPRRPPSRPPTIPSERAACNTPRARSCRLGLPPTAEYETDATTHCTHVYMFVHGSGRNEFYTSRENFCQRAYHRRYQYGVRYRYLVVNCDKRTRFRLAHIKKSAMDMRRRSADNALGYFSIYRARYISQRVLKHSPSVFALARVSRCLFHLATLPESRSRDEFNLSPRHKLHKAPKALCHLGSAYVIIVTISNFCSNRDKETAMLMELKD
ncbi:hypothetical protein ALC60_00267 [Trachymyrmex zeteki]|uniref:Uncharacterized protein n=1 Tax=Mycetomoellerius zeteki TaxID=64791 RepID=A0A151XJP6_9HYME|nr:hypothetical protein ALC60_00267 [Trachymyrmex zeteki]